MQGQQIEIVINKSSASTGLYGQIVLDGVFVNSTAADTLDQLMEDLKHILRVKYVSIAIDWETKYRGK